MEDGAPALEVGFNIIATDAFNAVEQLVGAVDGGTMRVLELLGQVEKASGRPLNFAPAIANITAYGSAATREVQTAAAAYAKAERGGESLSRQLERQAATFGKTSAEIRAMNVETRALAAEQAGLTELAGRLRTQEAELYARELAAIRQATLASEALAQEKALAAATAIAASEAEAKAARDAADAHRLLNAVAKQKMAAYNDEQAQTLVREAAAAKQAATEHERLAAMVRASHDAQEADAIAAERLREVTDPLYAATKRLNEQVAESTRLYHNGATAPAEYARQQQVLRDRLAGTAVAHEQMAAAGGRNAFALQEVALQLPDIFEGLATGQKPMQVFLQQGGQIVQIAMLAEGGIRGLALQVAALALPFTPLIVATGAAFGAFKLFQQQVKDDGDLTRYRDGLGLTHEEMLKLGDGVDKAGDKIARLSSVTITAGDEMAGIWKTIQDGVGDTSGWTNFENGAISAFKAVLDAWQATAAGITAGIYGTFDIVKVVWGSFPAVFGDLFVQGVNAAIAALNRLAKAGVDQINAVIATANKIPGVNLGAISAPQIDPIANATAGAAAKAAKQIGDSYSREYAAARKADAGFWKQVGDNARQHAKDRLKEEADAIKADRTPKKPKVDHNALNAEALEAQIKNLYALAEAYKVSGAAALIAEAREKAESEAIKKRADVEQLVALQVRLAIAQRVADAAKATAAMIEQAGVQEQVNAMVEAGLAPVAQANELVQRRTALLPLLAAQQAAKQIGDAKGFAAATQAVDDETAAQDRLAAAKRRTQIDTANTAAGNQLETLAAELRLIGATDAARTHELATIKAVQDATALGLKAGMDGYDEYIRKQVAVADQQHALSAAQDNYNAGLSRTADLLGAINDQAQAAGQGLSDAFGSAGGAIGSALSAITNYGSTQAQLAQERAAQVKAAGGDAKRLADIEKLYAIKSATAQSNAIGSVIAAGKGLFKQHSAGYKVMEGAEKAYRAIQLALAIKTAAEQIALMIGLTTTKVATDATMAASDTVRSTVEQANSAKSTVVKGVEAVVNAIKSLPFPANLAAGAATAAAIAALGVAIGGGFGGGKNTLAKANDGTGTVFGDSKATSESLSKSIDALKQVDTVTMTTSRDMLAALRSIDSQIGGLTNTLINAGNIGSIVGVSEKSGGAFGTSKKIVGSGITGGATTLDDVLASGAYGTDYYADVQKKKKLFGITTSTKYSTKTADDGADIDQQFGLILKGFTTAIGDAAAPLGIATSAVQSKLAGFVVDIGKIDLKGLSGTEIQDKLSAVFSAEGDKIAKAAIPGLERFQQAGEGYLQTLTRVASTVETVTGTLDKLGASATSLGIDASMAIAKQFDSLSDFTDAADGFFTSYYTQAEQATARSAQLAKVFGSLNLAMPDTLDGFRQLVEAQDLTTEAGASTYATLLKLAPAFADLKTSLEGAKSAADIASERTDLQRQILEAQGDTAAIRALDLAKLDPSNRALQEQLYAIQDAKDAADAASQLADAWKSVGDSILTEIDRIRGLSSTSAGGSFADLLGQFNAANTAARGGDQDAAKSLPALSQSLLTAAAAAATSRQELDRVQAQTAAQLEATYAAVSDLAGGASSSPLSPATVTAVAASQASTSTAAANDDIVAEVRALRDEVAQLRADNNAGHAATAGQVGVTNRHLDDVTAASGGDAISVTSAAA